MKRREVSARLPFVRTIGPLILSVVCGCSTVRVVSDTPNGGVIALPANSNCWPMYYRDRAEKLMTEKCPDGYRIEREEFVWNGKPGVEGHRYYESYFGYTNPDDESAPYLREEYRITYQAASAGGQQPKTDNSNPSSKPPTPPGNEELPPPRPVPQKAQ